MSENKELDLAFQFLQTTNRNIFLTGKAGTGKTTFLKSLSERLKKRFVVLAPTGVAALQAGGMTIHSFFQLPFHPYFPGAVLETRKFAKHKIDLIRSLDLIIIDEISMVRCDILDEIDVILRKFRRNARNKPFGGVQLLLIGDLNQLPPIATDFEENILLQYYNNIYFFSSKALLESNYITITLQNIYRQKESDFINILNDIRTKNLSSTSIERLNECYKPNILDDIPKNYIVLCSHNSQVDEINKNKLSELKGKEKTYKAEIEGSFTENSFPNVEYLRLKVGAQVMFLKNDYSGKENIEKPRYYNGKIGVITVLDDDFLKVKCPDNEEEIVVFKYTWQNYEYSMDKQTKSIKVEVKGYFSQFPVKLAWAITIHKSQGLTFDKAIINSNKAFSHGQVYVALSRCRSLDGLLLSEPFNSSSVKFDDRIKLFNENALANTPNNNDLQQANEDFVIENIISIFDFSELSILIKNLQTFCSTTIYKVFPTISSSVIDLCKEYAEDVEKVDLKYREYITKVKQQNTDYKYKIDSILKRSNSAKIYFLEKLDTVNKIVFGLIDVELDNSADNKKFNELIVKISIEKELKHRMLSFFDEKEFDIIKYLNYKNNLIAQGTDIELNSVVDDSSKNSKQNKTKAKTTKKTEDKLSQTDIADEELFNLLKEWRKQESKDNNLPAYTIISTVGLIGITNSLPTSKKDLLKIKGIGEKTAEKYGEQIFQLLQTYTTNKTSK
ncbi:MAG: AAA family ATPase [Bacteroidales bacterium]|nr:AAA family ATPase [Bacteroidales bacterium]